MTADAMRDFTVADVRDWAVSIGLSLKNADILVKQEIDGEALFKVTEEKLVTLYGMPGGPAGKLVNAVDAISAPLRELKGRPPCTTVLCTSPSLH